MTDEPVKLTELANRGDDRGWSFFLPAHWALFLGNVEDVHPMSIEPGYVRGNHFHRERRELFLVFFTGAWSMRWDSGPDTAVRSKRFDGGGVVMVEIEPMASHAIVNDGSHQLYVVGLSSNAFNSERPDAYPRAVS